MDPNAVHDPEPEHDHEHKRAAVTDEGQWDAGDGQHRDGHAHVLEDVREDERGDADNKEKTKLIAREKRDEETGEQKQGERTDEQDAANKSPLLTDRGKNIVVMHGCGRQKAEFDLRVWRFESFARPPARTDGDKRLVDRPRGALFINIWIDERGNPLLLVRF